MNRNVTSCLRLLAASCALCSSAAWAQFGSSSQPSPHFVPPIPSAGFTGAPVGLTAAVTAEAGVEDQTRATAISLNYCRAAFHRIRKYPTVDVLQEEQEEILNNLNLQGITDPEVIQLYTAVLDEINQIQVADRERHITNSSHTNSVQRKVTWDLVAFSTDLATAQYGSAVKQGANSWWDYRGMVHQRDQSLLSIERGRMNAVTQKSATFLDIFWKLARSRNIPDRWLVRADDLDALELAQSEPDAATRLRILRRMEPYMEAYPPYWYYLAKTQQELGELIAAGETFSHVAAVGEGHFRKDDMLAASLANLAAIQDHLGDPNSPRTAERALQFSTDVWEANLICARILERSGRVAAAEDAILRNLDVGLEQDQSRVFLASLYYHSEDRPKLARMLADPATVASLPAPVLLRCAACLGVQNTPPRVMQTVLASLQVQPRSQFMGDELLVQLSPAWQLHLARVDVAYRGRTLPPVQAERMAEGYQLRYPGRFDLASGADTEGGSQPVAISFVYPDETRVQVELQPDQSNEVQRGPTLGLLPIRTGFSRGGAGSGAMRVSGIAINNTRFAIGPASADLPADLPATELQIDASR